MKDAHEPGWIALPIQDHGKRFRVEFYDDYGWRIEGEDADWFDSVADCARRAARQLRDEKIAALEEKLRD